MNRLSYHRLCIILFVFLVPGITIVHGDILNWTNGDNNPVYNGPDKQTIVSFHDCVKIHSISTYHYNYGKGDTPGKISLFHDDGTPYGPWGTAGEGGTDGTRSVYWISRPGEVLKPGNYLVTDSSPGTWAQNDGSDNRGIVTIEYEPVPCDPDSGDINSSPDTMAPAIPEEFSEGVMLATGNIDLATLPGGATGDEKIPVIRQVGFTPLFRSVNGGENIYATIRVKNTGDRDLEDGYIIIRLVSQDGTYSSRGGMGRLPVITTGEERDIALIIPTIKPEPAGEGSNALFCTVYTMDGSISELMEGGYLESRGLIHLPRDNLITVTGCCREPYTADTIRGCSVS
jgi:hypothetical protein